MTIGSSGRFEGNIKAHRLLVSGYVEGVIDCASLEIVSQGRVFGELHSDEFVIEPGGQFLGESHPRREAPYASLEHEPASDARLAHPREHERQQAASAVERGESAQLGDPGAARFEGGAAERDAGETAERHGGGEEPDARSEPAQRASEPEPEHAERARPAEPEPEPTAQGAGTAAAEEPPEADGEPEAEPTEGRRPRHTFWGRR